MGSLPAASTDGPSLVCSCSTGPRQRWALGGHVPRAQSCPTLCNPLDCSPPGSSVHGISRQEYWSGDSSFSVELSLVLQFGKTALESKLWAGRDFTFVTLAPGPTTASGPEHRSTNLVGQTHDEWMDEGMMPSLCCDNPHLLFPFILCIGHGLL